MPFAFRPSPFHILSRLLALVLLVGGAWSFVAFARRPAVDRTWERVTASGVLRVAIDPTYPPFASGPADNPTGYDADLARLLAERLGLESGPLLWAASLDLGHVGFAVVGLFVSAWALALAVWRFGRIEERWAPEGL